MRPRLTDIRSELPPLVHLALPLIAGELGWVTMSLVDTIMLGHLPNSALAMSAAALAQVLFNTLCFGVGGILLGLDTLISQALGAREREEANRWLLHGLLLAVALSALLIGLFALAPFLLLHLPIDRAILAQAAPAMQGLNYGTLPLILTFTLRRYLQAANHARSIAFALISANLVNAAGDWLLIYGHDWSHTLRLAGHGLAIPAFGVTGSSWATSFARFYLLIVYAAALWWVDRKHQYGLLSGLRDRASRGIPGAPGERSGSLGWIQLQHLRRLLVLGAPAGASIFVEIAIFALVTSLIGTFGRLQLAGHEVALQCASTTFMVPLAISAATSVRVGHAVGRLRATTSTTATASSATRAAEDTARRAPAAAGWSGIGLGAVFMLCMSLVLLAAPSQIARLFTPDTAVIAAAVPLLGIAAGFQFFDGVQVTASGALRGVGNTTAPFLTQLVCYWIIGMPLGILLGFHRKLGAAGLWWGLLIALSCAAVVMCLSWQRAARLSTSSPALQVP